MDITTLLYHLDDHQFDIWVSEGDLLVGMQAGTDLTDKLRNFIQANRQQIIRRLLNNTFASRRNWLVANLGEVYSYQYSSGGYIFIERNEDETVTVYRCMFDRENKAANIKGLLENIPFAQAYQNARALLKWFYSKNPHLRNGKY